MPLTITSLYLPPHRAKTDLNAMQPVITGPHLLAGDINSHHRTWDAHGIPDGSGSRISEWCAMNAYSCANDPEIPTRKITRTIKGAQKHIITSPDVTFYKECTICDWNVNYTSTSDHAIISYTVSVGIDDLLLDSCTFAEVGNEYPRWNVSKANWDKYTKLAEAEIHNIEDLESVHAINDRLRKAMIQCAKQSVARGRYDDVSITSRILAIPIVKIRHKELQQLEENCRRDNYSKQSVYIWRIKVKEFREIFQSENRRLLSDVISRITPQDSWSWKFVREFGKRKTNIKNQVMKDNQGNETMQ